MAKNRNSKKGISPLIATVVVIGFVIVLAAGLVAWGTGFFKDLQTSQETSGKIQLACSQGLAALEVRAINSATVANTIEIQIDNRNPTQIEGYSLRLYASDGNIATVDKTADVLTAFGVVSGVTNTIDYSTTTPALADVQEVGMLPRVKADPSDATEVPSYCPNEVRVNVLG